MERVGEVPAAAGSPGLARFLTVLRRWRGMLVAAAVTAGLIGYFVASSGTPTYDTRAVLLVGPINTDLDTLRAAGQLAHTYAQLATSEPIVNATERRLGLRNLDPNISASANDVTRLLTITVRDHNAAQGARIANAHAQELVALARRRSTRTPGPGALQIVDPAEAGSKPAGPGALPIALVSALAGFLGALGLAMLLDRSRESLRGPEDLAPLPGAACVGQLSREPWRADTGLVARSPASRAADEYLLLAAKLRAVGERSLVLLRVDGTGTGVAANLAAAMAFRGARVALLDIEADRATLLTPDAAPTRLPSSGLADLPGAEDARAVLDEYQAEAEVVLVDAPSIQRSSSGLVWASVADGTLLLAQIDRSQRSDVVAAADSLRLVHARLLGTILGASPGILPRRAVPSRKPPEQVAVSDG
jgi:polysaccharide biosynthesis transport protein